MLRLAALVLPAAALALVPSATEAAPVLERVKLTSPPVVGKRVDVRVVARDPGAPVSGLVVRVRGRGQVFGSGGCRVSDPTGRPPGAPFTPGSSVRLTAPLIFRRKGSRKVIAGVDSGGCLLPPVNVFKGLKVIPQLPGAPDGLPLAGGPRPIEPPTRDGPSPSLPAPTVPVGPRPVAARRRCAGASQLAGRSAQALRGARRSLLCLLNARRGRRGLPGLVSNGLLLSAAEGHSRSMVQLGYFAHVAPGGRGLVHRVLGSGYLLQTLTWTLGENIAFGVGVPSTPRAIVRAWMASTPHRANILAPQFRHVGIGVVAGAPGRPSATGATYTTDFGVRRLQPVALP